MAQRRFAGYNETLNPNQGLGGGNVATTYSQSDYTGKATHISVFSLANSNAHVGLHTTTSTGVTFNALAIDNTDNAVTSGAWNDIEISNQAVDAGDWLAPLVQGEAGGVRTYRNTTPVAVTNQYRTGTYSAGIQDPETLNLQSRSFGVRAMGYPIPTILTAAGDGAIDVGETGAVITGEDMDDFSYSGVYARVWITNSATWGSETIKVEQTVTGTPGDESLTFDYTDSSSELSPGTGWYIWVETGLNQVQSTGEPLEIVSSGETVGSADMVGQSGIQTCSSVTVEIAGQCDSIGGDGQQSAEITSAVQIIGSCGSVGQQGQQLSSAVTVEIIGQSSSVGESGQQSAEISSAIGTVGSADTVGPEGDQSSQCVTVEIVASSDITGPAGQQSAEVSAGVGTIGSCDIVGADGQQSSQSVTVELVGSADAIGPSGSQTSEVISAIEIVGQSDMVGQQGSQSCSALTVEIIGNASSVGENGLQSSSAITLETVGTSDMTGPGGQQSSSVVTVEIVGQCSMVGANGTQECTITVTADQNLSRVGYANIAVLKRHNHIVGLNRKNKIIDLKR